MASGTKYSTLGEYRLSTKSVEEYQKRFQLFCTANGIADREGQEAQRTAIFLSSVGASTYSMLKNLARPKTVQELSLDEIVSTLQEHFEPKKIIIAERFCFYKRQQQQSESITAYLAELRRLAKHCDFGAYLATALRDQFVCGLLAKSVQQKLLAEAALTLESTVKLAEAHKIARQETQAMHHDMRRQAPSSQPETTFALQRTGERPPTKESSEKACYHCAERGHMADKCRMKSRECNICKKMGHIAKACRSKGNGCKEWKGSDV